MSGNKEKAIELQTKVLALVDDSDYEGDKKPFQDTLDAYKAGKLPSQQ